MNLIPRTLQLVVAVRLRVVRVDTLRPACSHHISAPTKLQCLQVSLFHRGLRIFCLLHHMPYSLYNRLGTRTRII